MSGSTSKGVTTLSEGYPYEVGGWEGRGGVTVTAFFLAYIYFQLEKLFIKRHNNKLLKLTKLCLGPI